MKGNPYRIFSAIAVLVFMIVSILFALSSNKEKYFSRETAPIIAEKTEDNIKLANNGILIIPEKNELISVDENIKDSLYAFTSAIRLQEYKLLEKKQDYEIKNLLKGKKKFIFDYKNAAIEAVKVKTNNYAEKKVGYEHVIAFYVDENEDLYYIAAYWDSERNEWTFLYNCNYDLYFDAGDRLLFPLDKLIVNPFED